MERLRFCQYGPEWITKNLNRRPKLSLLSVALELKTVTVIGLKFQRNLLIDVIGIAKYSDFNKVIKITP